MRSIIRYVCLVLCAALPFAAALSCASPRKTTLSYLNYFDTVTTFTAYGLSDEDETAIDKLISERLEEYHMLFDIYENYDSITNIKSINDAAGIAPVRVNTDVINLLRFSIEMYNKTNGAVNICMGSVLSLWHDAREAADRDPETAAIPSENELIEASLHCHPDALVIDESSSSVFITDSKMSLDVGATAKGYAAQLIHDELLSLGFGNFLLNMGGNVISEGVKPDGSPWSVGIEDPRYPRATLCSVAASDGISVVTSGSHQRVFTLGGINYHHIIHPDTLYPENTYLSVSVLCNNSAKADALSTALFNMDLSSGMDMVNTIDGVDAMWLLADGTVAYSNGFERYKK